jgi:glycine hydroxymethyltransferase
MIMCKVADRLHDRHHPESKKNLAQMIDSAVFPGLQGGPHDHVNAAKAVAFHEALQPDYKRYASQILKNAKVLADELMSQGFRLVTDGTDNHLMVVDVWEKGISGKEAQNLLDTVGIYLNKNTIPFDTRSPFDPSGIRLGTPALTTRGMKEGDMREVGALMARALLKRNDERELSKVREGVAELCKSFPLYPELPDGYFHQ